jgi:orotidine-5'-phosphate decarboxylase
MTRFKDKLIFIQAESDSMLCIGLDPVVEKIPSFLKLNEDFVFSFNKAIIDATSDLVCAYKPNLGFYLPLGVTGLKALIRTIQYIPEKIPVILDAKFGDVEHTSASYAKAVFEEFKADSVTLSPYLGLSALEPFFSYPGKSAFVLALTSNPGNFQFQSLKTDSKPLFQSVAESVQLLIEENDADIGLVVGATHADDAISVRKCAPDAIFLIPGIGPQGGDIEKTVEYGFTKSGIAPIVVASRNILYASTEKDFEEAARKKAIEIKKTLNRAKK